MRGRAVNRSLGAVIALVLGLGLAGLTAGCAADLMAACQRAGGTYAGGTCSRWSPGQQAAQEACEHSGGVFLQGEETCEFGEGGP
jgi:hypothetical protein